MSFIITQAGQLIFLEASLSDTIKLRLYSNNRTPSSTDTISDYTEVSAAGYAEKTFTGDDWTIEIDELTDNYVAALDDQTFTMTETATVYGYFITSEDDTLILAERFPTAPQVLDSDGGNIIITPQIGLR